MCLVPVEKSIFHLSFLVKTKEKQKEPKQKTVNKICLLKIQVRKEKQIGSFC